MRLHTFEAHQWVSSPIDQTFEFFADAANLEAITPPFLNFRILTQLPVEMRVGARIDYRIALYGLPMTWKTNIDQWQPGRSFIDRQLSGPYAQWIHLHTFESSEGGTQLYDRVQYALPLDPLSRPGHPLFVRPTIERIFAHRRKVIAERFGGEGRERA
jgi:ligand-binding SRPBCC domain-containing protein